MNKILKGLCLLLLLSFCIVSIYGKNMFHHINVKEYVNNSHYFQLSVESIEGEYFPKGFNETFIDDLKIKNLDDLVNSSDHVLKVKTTTNKFIGNGIVMPSIIKKVIKSDTLKVEEKINIYDSVINWNSSAADYIENAVPLNSATEYIVFLKKAPNPNIKNSYIQTSIIYGHFKMDNDFKSLYNYYELSRNNKKIISISEAATYDFIGNSIEKEQIYKKIKIDLLQLLNES